jgi:hypothetical protein
MSFSQAEAATCKTLKGEMVGFGEHSTRAEAEDALSREIAAWEVKYSLKANPKNQKTVCKDYIKFLNEFECKAEAVLCR